MIAIPALYIQGGYGVRELRAFSKYENQPLSPHWVVENYFHHRKRAGDEVRWEDIIEGSYRIANATYGLGSGFFLNPWDTPTHSGMLLKLTKQHHEGSAHFNWGCHPALWTRTSRSELFIKGRIYLGTTFVNRIRWQSVDKRIEGPEDISVEDINKAFEDFEARKRMELGQNEGWKMASKFLTAIVMI